MIFGIRGIAWKGAALAAVAVLLQIVSASSGGIRPDYALMTLIVLGASLTLGELTIITVTSAFLLVSRPGGGVALLVFVALPLALFALRRVMPWQPWFSNAALAFLGAVAFLLATVPRAFLAAPGASSVVIGADLLVGLVIYVMMQERPPRRTAR
jgi:hypothetical protein